MSLCSERSPSSGLRARSGSSFCLCLPSLPSFFPSFPSSLQCQNSCFNSFFFYCCSSTVVCLFLLPLHPTPAIPTSLSWFHPPWVLSMCPLYIFFDDPSSFPPIIPCHHPSGYCQIVLYFNVSGYILLACLFCWLGSTYRWDHMVFVFHHLAYFT